MKSTVLAPLALALCFSGLTATAFASPATDIPAECRNLGLMQAQLLNTRFHSNTTGNGTSNPAQLTLKAGNGFKISKVDFLGGNSVDPSNVGKTACDQDSTLCTNPANAGGAIDWDRVTISTTGA